MPLILIEEAHKPRVLDIFDCTCKFGIFLFIKQEYVTMFVPGCLDIDRCICHDAALQQYVSTRHSFVLSGSCRWLSVTWYRGLLADSFGGRTDLDM
jgi:hypothetical protein